MSRADKIRQALNLNFGYWKHMPDGLLLLAFTDLPEINDPRTNKYKLKYRENIAHYRILEFHGDHVLSTLVTNVILDNLGLNDLPKSIEIHTDFGSNNVLRDTMISQKSCRQFFSDANLTEKHNPCSNAFEALLGAMYYFGIDKKNPRHLGPAVMGEIYNWYINLDHIKNLIDRLQSNISVDDLLGMNIDDIVSHINRVPSLDQQFEYSRPIILVANYQDSYRDLYDQVVKDPRIKTEFSIVDGIEYTKVKMGKNEYIGIDFLGDPFHQILEDMISTGHLIIINNSDLDIIGSISSFDSSAIDLYNKIKPKFDKTAKTTSKARTSTRSVSIRDPKPDMIEKTVEPPKPVIIQSEPKTETLVTPKTITVTSKEFVPTVKPIETSSNTKLVKTKKVSKPPVGKSHGGTCWSKNGSCPNEEYCHLSGCQTDKDKYVMTIKWADGSKKKIYGPEEEKLKATGDSLVKFKIADKYKIREIE